MKRRVGGGLRIQDMMDNLGDEWWGITSCSLLLQCFSVLTIAQQCHHVSQVV